MEGDNAALNLAPWGRNCLIAKPDESAHLLHPESPRFETTISFNKGVHWETMAIPQPEESPNVLTP